jgi:hypothetical protein
MHDPANELRGIYIPRTRVNKGKEEPSASCLGSSQWASQALIALAGAPRVAHAKGPPLAFM